MHESSLFISKPGFGTHASVPSSLATFQSPTTILFLKKTSPNRPVNNYFLPAVRLSSQVPSAHDHHPVINWLSFGRELYQKVPAYYCYLSSSSPTETQLLIYGGAGEEIDNYRINTLILRYTNYNGFG